MEAPSRPPRKIDTPAPSRISHSTMVSKVRPLFYYLTILSKFMFETFEPNPNVLI